MSNGRSFSIETINSPTLFNKTNTLVFLINYNRTTSIQSANINFIPIVKRFFANENFWAKAKRFLRFIHFLNQ
jgi:hypothetical protein